MKTSFILLFVLSCTWCLSASAKGYVKDSTTRFSDSTVLINKKKTSSKDKVCSCEIMWLDLGNEQVQIIGVFAEKTAGQADNDNKLFTRYLQKEKKRINHYLAYRILQTRRVFQSGSCRETYSVIKAHQKKLRLYSILDLDILAKLHNRRVIFW